MSEKYYVGVDVGTGGVRAALVTESGSVLKTHNVDINIYNTRTHFYEQSSNQIWSHCCEAIKTVIQDAPSKQIFGIGFDATCSLVVLDEDFQSVSVDPDGDDEKNIIMWLDHRAEKQADFINSKKHEVLKFVGGNMSLEMQPPKLLWLKQNLPEKCWRRAKHFFDLPDFLTWKATGSLSRSLCSLVCKWTYSPQDGWNKKFWTEIGLNDLTYDNFSKIGSEVLQVGDAVGNGISNRCQDETNLQAGTAVAVSVIDAHCGGIGTIGCNIDEWNLPCRKENLTERIVLICGTSSCHMAISETPLFVPGIWGPYFSAMIPNFWLNEGGQSAVANLLEYIVHSHCAYQELQEISIKSGKHVYTCLNEVLQKLAVEKHLPCVDTLTSDIHVLPDFHGNRSPLADPNMKGIIDGLTLDKSLNGLAVLYLATLQSLALGTNHILMTMSSHGHKINTIFMTGGLQKNSLFVQVHANATGMPVVLGKETETVLLGAAVLASIASNKLSMQETMKKMCHVGKIIEPEYGCESYYGKKYKVFLLLGKQQKKCRELMDIK